MKFLKCITMIKILSCVGSNFKKKTKNKTSTRGLGRRGSKNPKILCKSNNSMVLAGNIQFEFVVA